MELKIQRLPLKTRIVFGVVAGLFNGLGLFLWDYFKEEPIIWERYIFQAVFTGLFMAIAFRNKITKA
ncbi:MULTISPECIES: hypothetical protein [Bizionia]|uniref:Uncharacterized protein n=1 Tax=Bizionia algoritergicola TaxID=291187 RepID=A0A5D0QWU8_9FLAO|nr:MULTISPECIES: hypothetical protein [Bizionia]OBX21453.1 hypothetical protein BAA08_12500 [Bizionia sp. APA-3]TYB73703.1 hypothetical protein ES675_08615 [Bizionia algoritergicola]